MSAPIAPAPEPPHWNAFCLTSSVPTLSPADPRQFSQIRRSGTGRRAIGSREIMPIYWRRLIEMGVPINEAKVIAWAIVRYDAGKILPDLQQQQMLKRYCRFICRAALWRSELLPSQATRQLTIYFDPKAPR